MSQSITTDPFDERLEELMVGYVLDALSAPERQEFEELLHTHPQLQQQFAQCQEVMGLLAEPMREVPPPQLRQRILAIAEAPAAIPTPAPAQVLTAAPVPPIQPQPSIRRRTRWWRRVAIVAAALAALGLVVDNLLLRRQVQNLELAFAEMQMRETHNFELKAKNTGNLASASIVLDIETGKALVGVRNLPQLKPGEVYRLWAITADRKILCGEFNTLPSGQLVGVFPIPVKEYTSEIKFMRISREAHTTPPDTKTRVMVLTSEA